MSAHGLSCSTCYSARVIQLVLVWLMLEGSVDWFELNAMSQFHTVSLCASKLATTNPQRNLAERIIH